MKPKTFTMLPPSPDKCPQCAVEHKPEEPHWRTSMFYDIWFHQQHGRYPTWADAMAHCTPEVQAAWRIELERRGIIDASQSEC